MSRLIIYLVERLSIGVNGGGLVLRITVQVFFLIKNFLVISGITGLFLTNKGARN